MADSPTTTNPPETPADIFFSFKEDVHLVVEYVALVKDALKFQGADDTLLGASRILDAAYLAAVKIEQGFYEAFPHGERAA